MFGPVERAPFVACASAHSRSVGEWEWDEVSVLLLGAPSIETPKRRSE